jgi:hypothetical protein
MTVRADRLIFDDYIATGTCGAAYAYTADALSDALGLYDVIACEAVLDNVSFSGVGSFKLYLQHSADDRNFVFSNGMMTPGMPELNLASLSTTAINFGITAYQGTYPLLGKVRFALQFGEMTTAAHVKLFVIQRDLA